MIHRSQFLAKFSSSTTFKVSNRFNSHIVSNGYWDFWFRSNTQYEIINKNCLVIGVCFPTNSIENAKCLLEKCTVWEDVLLARKELSGRFVIFWKEYVLTDFSTNYQIFYTAKGDFFVSSSLGLISTELGIKKSKERETELKKLSFFPAPLTIYEGVNVLLSFQIIKQGVILNNEIGFRDLGITKEQYLKNFIKLTNNFLLNIARSNFKIVLPLTGGIDSRTLLAFLLANDLEFSCYTSYYEKIKFHDLLIPRILEIITGINNYKLVIPNRPNRKLLDDFDKHTGYNCIDKDRYFYATSSYPLINEDVIRPTLMLRGAGWAVFRGFYTLDLRNQETVESRLDEIILNTPNLKHCPMAIDSLTIWLGFIKDFKLDWRFQYYVDQRLNAWDGAIEQSIQMNGFEPLQLINNFNQMEALYNYYLLSDFKIRNNEIQRRIIKTLDYRLDLLPYNFLKGNYSRANKWLMKIFTHKTHS